MSLETKGPDLEISCYRHPKYSYAAQVKNLLVRNHRTLLTADLDCWGERPRLMAHTSNLRTGKLGTRAAGVRGQSLLHSLWPPWTTRNPILKKEKDKMISKQEEANYHTGPEVSQ